MANLGGSSRWSSLQMHVVCGGVAAVQHSSAVGQGFLIDAAVEANEDVLVPCPCQTSSVFQRKCCCALRYRLRGGAVCPGQITCLDTQDFKSVCPLRLSPSVSLMSKILFLVLATVRKSLFSSHYIGWLASSLPYAVSSPSVIKPVTVVSSAWWRMALSLSEAPQS